MLALKEWSGIVDVLGKGKQSIVLRKGGIAEDNDQFDVKGKTFLLFPTQFHEAEKHLKPQWHPFMNGERFFQEGLTRIQYYATLAHYEVLKDWEKVHKLDSWHAWTEETIRERYERWNASIALLVLQVFELNTPLVIDAGLPAYSGCKSWVEVEAEGNFLGKEVINKTIL
ncbi:MAG: DUF1802 family protein [Cytophagaceae bacterium]|jgi:hypothetical protein|nr:DUF1802 family protein [Cytophagaceae bacterium]